MFKGEMRQNVKEGDRENGLREKNCSWESSVKGRKHLRRRRWSVIPHTTTRARRGGTE